MGEENADLSSAVSMKTKVVYEYDLNGKLISDEVLVEEKATVISSNDNKRLELYPNMDAYQILGVQKDADTATIKSSYRKLVYTWHPDRFPDSENMKEEGSYRMEIINRAWYCLSDIDRRKRYDEFGEEGVGTSAASEQDIIDSTGLQERELSGEDIVVAVFKAFDVILFLIESLLKAIGPILLDGGYVAWSRVQDTFFLSDEFSEWKPLKNIDGSRKKEERKT